MGGGGLAAGVALAIKASLPQVKIFGVQSRLVPSAQAAFEAGKPVAVTGASTLADGINVTCLGRHTFPLLRQYLDGLALVSEAEIAAAVLLLLEKEDSERGRRCGSGRGPAALPGRPRPRWFRSAGHQRRQHRYADLGTGRAAGLLNSNRLLTLIVVLPDSPGSLGKLAGLLGETRANILHLSHDRLGLDLPLRETRVKLDLETLGAHHCDQIMATLQQAGYRVERQA